MPAAAWPTPDAVAAVGMVDDPAMPAPPPLAVMAGDTMLLAVPAVPLTSGVAGLPGPPVPTVYVHAVTPAVQATVIDE
ncbi:MAG: hypothetical protein WCP35_17120 [Verrucomicrobiota bacterium]